MGIIFANEKTIQKMRELAVFEGNICFEVPLNGDVDSKLADHTDLSIFVSDAIYVAPSIYMPFLNHWNALLEIPNFEVVCGTKHLKNDYPHDIAYNAVQMKHHFFHKLAHTEPKILEAIKGNRINVKQGYTRCSTLMLTNEAVITEDIALAQIYRNYGYDVLTIEKGYVTLPGYKYGFFGGTGGVVDNLLVLNGSLKHHPDCDTIKGFVNRYDMHIIELHDGPLLDCGSILFLNTQNKGG